MYTNRARYWADPCTQCTVCVAWSWCGFYAANAVEYGTFVYCILQFTEQYNTAFNNTARSNIATFAYRTRTVFNTEINDYWYYYRVGTGTAKAWEKPITAADDQLRINGI